MVWTSVQYSVAYVVLDVAAACQSSKLATIVKNSDPGLEQRIVFLFAAIFNVYLSSVLKDPSLL
jgi:hypothetical protein